MRRRDQVSGATRPPLAVGLLALGLLAARFGVSQPAPDAPRPNIVVILADDLGYSDLGCYGSEIPTPHLDRLAAEGRRMMRFYNTSKCHPTRASLLTGVYPWRNGYGEPSSHTQPLPDSVATIAELLRPAGYRSYMSGKHHGTDNPIYRGFDRYAGLNDGAANYFNPGTQRPGEPAPARKRTRRWSFDARELEPYTPSDPDFYATDAFTDYALDFLAEHDSARGEQPFLLYLAYTAPHDPLMAPAADIAAQRGRYDAGYAAVREARLARQRELGLWPAGKTDGPSSTAPARHADWDALTLERRTAEARRMEVYAAMIARLDANVGRLLAGLRERGQLDNTLVLFLSDNGASAEVVTGAVDHDPAAPIGSLARWESLGPDWANVANAPLDYYKVHPHEGGIRTPAIAWWPGRIRAGEIDTATVGHVVDIVPTALALAGVSYRWTRSYVPLVSLDGVDLSRTLTGASAEAAERTLLFRYLDGDAVVRWPHKALRHPGTGQGDWALYDLARDPGETTDLAGRRPWFLAQLTAAWREEFGVASPR